MEVTKRVRRLLHVGMQAFVLLVFFFFHAANVAAEGDDSDGSGDVLFGIGLILLFQGMCHFGGWALVHYNAKVHEHD